MFDVSTAEIDFFKASLVSFSSVFNDWISDFSSSFRLSNTFGSIPTLPTIAVDETSCLATGLLIALDVVGLGDVVEETGLGTGFLAISGFVAEDTILRSFTSAVAMGFGELDFGSPLVSGPPLGMRARARQPKYARASVRAAVCVWGGAVCVRAECVVRALPGYGGSRNNRPDRGGFRGA